MNLKSNNRISEFSQNIRWSISRSTSTLQKIRFGRRSTNWMYQFCMHIVELQRDVRREQMNLRMLKSFSGMMLIGRRTGRRMERTRSGPRKSCVTPRCISGKSNSTTQWTWGPGYIRKRLCKMAMLNSVSFLWHLFAESRKFGSCGLCLPFSHGFLLWDECFGPILCTETGIPRTDDMRLNVAKRSIKTWSSGFIFADIFFLPRLRLPQTTSIPTVVIYTSSPRFRSWTSRLPDNGILSASLYLSTPGTHQLSRSLNKSTRWRKWTPRFLPYQFISLLQTNHQLPVDESPLNNLNHFIW